MIRPSRDELDHTITTALTFSAKGRSFVIHTIFKRFLTKLVDNFIGYDVVGLVGVVLYIAAYAGLQFGYFHVSGYSYTVINLVAAALVLVSLINNFNLSSAIIQITWIAISVLGLAKVFYLHHATRLNSDEIEFMKSKFPSVSKSLMQAFLHAGTWIDVGEGTDLALEGAPIGALIYLFDGAAYVHVDGKVVGFLKSDSFIGELTCFDAGPATASVTLEQQARIFRIGTEALNRTCIRNPDLKFALENAIGRDTRNKLVAANARMGKMKKKLP